MKGGSTTLLIGLGAPKPGKAKAMSKMIGEEPEADEAAGDTKAGKLAAVKALRKALDDGDDEAVNEALSAHYELCALENSAPADDDDSY